MLGPHYTALELKQLDALEATDPYVWSLTHGS